MINQIIQTDCLLGLKQLNDCSIDSIITDPPYWLGSKLKIDAKGQYVGAVTDCKHTGSTWAIGDGYWLEEIMKECFRVLKHGGYVLLFSIDRLSDLPTYNARRAGFDICQSVYWKFKQGMPKGTDSRKRVEALILQGNAGTRALRRQEYDNPTGCEVETKSGTNGFIHNVQIKMKKDGTEPLTEIGKKVDGTHYGLACLAPAIEVICCFRKPYKYNNIAEDIVKSQTDSTVRPAVVNTEKYRATHGIFPSQVLEVSKPSRSERKDNDHPTVKPIKLMEELVSLFTLEEDVVLDPFCGSGTTCLASKNLNRKYIGFDVNPQYVELTQKRLNILVP